MYKFNWVQVNIVIVYVRSTAVLGVMALWIYCILLACIPVLCYLINPEFGPLDQDTAGFRQAYIVYLAIQFISVGVASVLLTVSVVNRLRRGRHTSNSSFEVTRRFQTVTADTDDQTRRCIIATVICAACWTPFIAFQLVDQLGCRLSSDALSRTLIISIVIRQVSPLIGLSAGLLLPVIYLRRCPLRPGCRNNIAMSDIS